MKCFFFSFFSIRHALTFSYIIFYKHTIFYIDYSIIMVHFIINTSEKLPHFSKAHTSYFNFQFKKMLVHDIFNFCCLTWLRCNINQKNEFIDHPWQGLQQITQKKGNFQFVLGFKSKYWTKLVRDINMGFMLFWEFL